MNSGFRWIVKVAHCCGVRYRMARLVGRPWPGTHHSVCVHCRHPLVYWLPSAESQKRLKNQRQQRARAELTARGLTTKGTVRQVKLRPELAGLTGSARHTAYMKLRYAENNAAGLTARGTVPILPRRQPTPQMRIFAEIKAEVAQLKQEAA